MFFEFMKIKKTLALYMFSWFFAMSTMPAKDNNISDITNRPNENSTEINQNILHTEKDVDIIQEQAEQKDEKSSKITILQRTILKTIVETFWNYKIYLEKTKDDKKQSNEYYVEPFNYNEIGKILSNLTIDEIISKPQHTNTIQKLTELLIPTIISFLIVDGTIASFINNEKFSQNHTNSKYIQALLIGLSLKLIDKIFKKLIMVRCLQQPGTRTYQLANAIAIASAFYTSNSQGKNFLERYINPKCINVWAGTEKVVLDQAKLFLEALDLGKHLKPKQRKKAIGKISQVFLKPHVQILLKKIYDDYKNMAI